MIRRPILYAGIALVTAVLAIYVAASFAKRQFYREFVANETVRVCGLAAVKYYQDVCRIPASLEDLSAAGLLARDPNGHTFAVPELANNTPSIYLSEVVFDDETVVGLRDVPPEVTRKSRKYVGEVFAAVRSGGNIDSLTARNYLRPIPPASAPVRP